MKAICFHALIETLLSNELYDTRDQQYSYPHQMEQHRQTLYSFRH